MRQHLLRWLKLNEEEIALFLWTAALLFLVRSSGMLLNNYAETTFLKRFGVEYLPIVNMLNSIATFFVTGVLATFMARLSGARLLSYLFVFCGLTVTAIRLLIPLGYEIIYPILFMLKSQYELLQALLFWNLANDLFNTRQSKRIFPLLTAGGVIGLIIGSFGTPYMAKALKFDNLLLVYLGTTVLGALVVKGMSLHLSVLVRAEKKSKTPKKRTPMLEEFKKIVPLLKESALLKIVLILTFMPNVVVPIMNYQFNFAVDEYFASESGMIGFFGYFRGVLNIISLIILLFVGRFYGRFGLPVALMFHPFNYMIAFMGFLLRFDIFAAMYARMSTNILRTTINMPASSILIGLFPESYRSMIRPFLRGTVVRMGLFLGSGLILASTNLFHPRYLTLVALPFVLAWLTAPFLLKKNYASILMDLISKNMLDLKSLEANNLGNLFKKDRVGNELRQSFLQSTGRDALWYARLLKNLDVEDLDQLILKTIHHQDVQTQVQLLNMLSDHPHSDTLPILQGLLDPGRPHLTVAVLKALKRLAAEDLASLDLSPYLRDPHPEVRGHAAGCLYHRPKEDMAPLIASWLDSEDISERRAGVIASGASGEASYTPKLEALLQQKSNEAIAGDILQALAKLEDPDLNRLALAFLDHSQTEIRKSALRVLEITDDTILNRVIQHLGEPVEAVRELAKEKIKDASYLNGQILIESLSRPNHRLREALFELLEDLEIKNLDLFRFTKKDLEQAYLCLAKALALEQLITESQPRELLRQHLLEKKNLLLENIFRVLAIHDQDQQMRTVFRGLFSLDPRHQANSIELLSDIMDKKTFNMVLPLIESASPRETLISGKKFFTIPNFETDGTQLFSALLTHEDWLEVLLALEILNTEPEMRTRLEPRIQELQDSPNAFIRRPALQIAEPPRGGLDSKEHFMDTEMPIVEKILLLKNIAIFSGLNVSELGAIAAVTEEVDFGADETVIREGESGEKVFLIISGEVAVFKAQEEDKQIQLDTMGAGNYFGEMALFEEAARSASIRTQKNSRFLILHKQEFNEIVREYPRIALQICAALSHRLRNLQSKLTQQAGE